MTEPLVRVVTHKAVAKVARLMGYTPQGLKELCERCAVKNEWATIGLTRGTNERVAARLNPLTRKYEFSVGNAAFVLTDDECEAQRIRDEVAEAVVNRVKATRPVVNRKLLKVDQGPTTPEDDHGTDGLSRPETMIISPVAPRDPRGLYAPQGGLSAPRNGMSAP